jgi:hypothetical protein
MAADVRFDYESVCLPNVGKPLQLRNEDLDPSLYLIDRDEPWQSPWGRPRALLPLSYYD